MTVDKIVAALLSGDPSQVLGAAHEVIGSRDRPGLQQVAAVLPEIERATVGLDLGGMLRPNSSHLELALRKLRSSSIQTGCFCGLYPDYDLFLPRREQELGHVDLIAEDADPDEWSTVYRCKCRDCGKLFRAVQQDGYHYPWAAWTAESKAQSSPA